MTPLELLELGAPAVRYLRAFTNQCWLPVRGWRALGMEGAAAMASQQPGRCSRRPERSQCCCRPAPPAPCRRGALGQTAWLPTLPTPPPAPLPASCRTPAPPSPCSITAGQWRWLPYGTTLRCPATDCEPRCCLPGWPAGWLAGVSPPARLNASSRTAGHTALRKGKKNGTKNGNACLPACLGVDCPRSPRLCGRPPAPPAALPPAAAGW